MYIYSIRCFFSPKFRSGTVFRPGFGLSQPAELGETDVSRESGGEPTGFSSNAPKSLRQAEGIFAIFNRENHHMFIP
jgi:hypothetical protein